MSHRLIFDLRFNGGLVSPSLLLFTPGYPVHRAIADVHPLSGPALPITVRDGISVQTEVGELDIAVPFWGIHDVRMRGDRQVCSTDYVAFAMNTVTARGYLVRPGQRSQRQQECDHNVQFGRGRFWSGEWEVLMQLDGIEPAGSSLGNVMAISQRGHRIAMANWTTVKIWCVQPEVIRLGRKAIQAMYPERQRDEDGLYHLPCVQLPSHGVVHRITFDVDDNILYGMTDEGLVHWNMSPSARGVRTVAGLAS